MDAAVLAFMPLKDLSTYQLAQRAGWQYLRHSGAFFLPELVIASTLRCLRRPDGTVRATFDDGHPNLRRHPLLLGDRDSKKGAVVDLWLSRIVGAKGHLDLAADPSRDLVVCEAQGGSTWESQRGGANSGRLVAPAFPGIHILYVSELLSWLSHDPRQAMRIVEQLNVALQEGRIAVDLVKMKGMPEKELRRFAETCKAIGVNFNPIKAAMEYRVDFIFVGCTHEIPPKLWGDMLASGVVSRFGIVDFRPDEDTLDTYLRNQFGPGDQPALQALRDFHEYAWACRFAHVDNPLALATRANEAIQDDYQVLAETLQRSRRDFRIGREMQYLSQLIAFSAASRAIRARMAAGLPAGLIERLDYTDADADFAVEHARRYILPIAQRWAEKDLSATGSPLHEEALAALKEFAESIQTKVERHGEVVEHARDHVPPPRPVQVFNSGDFLHFYTKTKKMGHTVYYARMALLVGSNAIQQVGTKGRERIYRITDSQMEAFGLRSERQADAEEHRPDTTTDEEAMAY